MDAEFFIKIRTTLEDQGIKLTDAQFKELEEQTKKSSKAAEEFGEIHKAAASKIELSHREIRESVGAVGRAFGGLADVGLWLSPVTAALALVLFLVDKVKEHFSALNDKIREYIENARQIRSDHMAALADATRATADATADFARQARTAAENQDTENQAMQDRIALNDAYIDGLKRVEAAKERAYEAEIERDVAANRITREEGERRKDIARENLENQNSDLDRQKELARIAEHKRQVEEAQGRIPDEEAARDAALQRAEHPSVSASDLQKEIDRQSKTLTDQNAKVAASLTEADQHRTPGTMAWDIDKTADIVAGKPVGTLAAASAKIAEKRAADEQKVADATAAYIKALQAQKDAAENAVKDAKAEADVQNKKLEKDRETVRVGNDRIKQEQALADIHSDAAQAVSQWNQKTDVTREGGPLPPGFVAAHWEAGPGANIGASDAVAKARNLEAMLRDQTAATADPEAVKELHQLLDRMMGYVENHSVTVPQHNELASEIRSISSRLATLEMRVNINRGSP